MASEVIKLNLIPKGEMPVFHASQFDTGRLITCELYRGEDTYSVPEGYTVELHCRKVDNNIVTMASTLINDNVVTFTSTEQLTACNGNNLCEVAILDEGYRIGTLNFILEVEIDPLKGGITSTSEIHNLETQVEEITTEIIGENYYDKSEVDDLLDQKADASSVYTKSETDTKLALKANAADVYTKSQTDSLLDAKADVSDLPDMTDYYTKTATDALLDDKASINYVDSALALKANAADVYTKTQTDTALATKADKSDTYTKEQVDALIDNIFPTFTASGTIATFTTALTKPLINVTADVSATVVTACGVNLINVPDAVVINTGITYDTLVTTINVIAGVTYTLSCMQENSMTSNERNTLIIGINGVRTYESSTSNYHLSSGIHSLTFTPSVSGACEIRIWGHTLSNQTTYDKFQLEVGSTVTTYKSYNGQTVPVADATTLTTQSGVNNVYADAGNVTVQYKYMSM